MTRTRLGWLLLGGAGIVGALTIYHGTFSDEADVLVAGRLIADGSVLYTSIFSHHFPWPYWWSALFIAAMGPSILVIRASLLVFQIAAFAVAMRLSGFVLTLGLTAFAWSILRIFYRGNQVLYSGFAGPALLVVGVIVLALLTRRIRATLWHGVIIGGFAGIAVLNDPLSIYALGLAFVFCLFAAWRQALIAAGIATLFLGFAGVGLLATGSLDAFYAQAIAFNADIYSRYMGVGPLRLVQWAKQASSGLDVMNEMWRNFDPLRPFTLLYSDIDKWVFTGIMFRLAVIVASLWLLLRRHFLAGIFLYLYAAALLVIEQWDFRAQGFVLLALFSAALVVTTPLPVRWQPLRRGDAPPVWRQFVALGLRIVQVGLAIMFGWLMLRAGVFTVRAWSSLTYAANFDGWEHEGKRIADQLACGRHDVVLGYYPGDPHAYWFSGLQPMNRYLYLYPWVAEAALPEVLAELPSKRAVVYLADVMIWDTFPTEKYLQPLLQRLKSEYVGVGDGWYVTPDLKGCQTGRIEVVAGQFDRAMQGY